MDFTILENLCDPYTKGIKAKDVQTNGKYPVYGASGLVGYLDSYEASQEYIGVIKDGAGVGRVNIYPEKSSLLGTMQYLFPKKHIDARYLMYLVRYMNLGHNSAGAAIPHIYFKDYKKNIVKNVDFDTQKIISRILYKIEKTIEIKKNQLKSLDELVKSRFIEMFKDEANSLYSISDIADICRGASPRPISKYITENNDGVNWIKIGDVDENDIYITQTKEKITREGANKSRFVKPGDFILSNSMSFGRPYILDINGCVHDGWLIISNYEKHLDSLFFYYMLRSDFVQLQFDGSANGACVRNLNSDLVKKVKIYKPSMQKQKLFVEFAKQIDKSKFIVQKQIQDLQELLDSKMDEYFG